jgi:enamine deaminase RidA (YjgF/YER057c/UK114 family)
MGFSSRLDAFIRWRSPKASEGKMTEIETHLKELGWALPDPPTPVGAYLLSRQTGDLLFLSGTTCYVPGGILYKGRLGAELDVQQGYAAARQTMLNLLGVVKAVLGDLDRVECVVKLNGYVNSTPDFVRQPEVINGASDLLVQLYGERGKHARTSIGVNILPNNIPVEIEMVVQVRR